jgi:parvulin-like peptidyl-prolyl isomerase
VIVNGQRISVAALDTELHQITSNKSFVAQVESGHEQVFGAGTGTYSSTFTSQILDRRISVDLVEQRLAGLKIAVSNQELAIASSVAAAGFGGASVFAQFPRPYQQQLISDTAALDTYEAHLAHVQLTSAAIESFYRDNLATFTQYCASQILVPTQADANVLRSKILAGASFASVAQASSQDPNTASHGGVIGCGQSSSYAQAFGTAFAAVVVGTPLNTPSQPVQTSSGFSLIDVTSKSVPPVSSVVSEVVTSLLGSRAQTLLGDAIQLSARSSTFVVNPQYGSLSLNSTGGVGVIPPSAPSLAAQQFFKTPSA